MKKGLLLLLLVVSGNLLFSQARRSFNSENPALLTSRKLFEEKKYKDAIPSLEEALRSKPDNAEILFMLASSLYNTRDYAKSYETHQKLMGINPDYKLQQYLEAGGAAIVLKKWDDAQRLYETLKQKTGDAAGLEGIRHRSDYMINYARQALVLEREPPTMATPVALPSPVNSGEGDFLPMLDATGTLLYFTSRRKGGFSPESASATEGDEDLYFTAFQEGQWSAPALLPAPLNSSGHDGAASFSADGQLMVYAACDRKGGIGSCDLYSSTLIGNAWSEPRNLGNVVNSDAWDAQSTLSADGSKIIFTSNRSGGYGAEDLFMVERNPFGEWGVPMNLGGIINTPFSEYSPFISQDGKTLYFSSSGHAGFGGLDIFKSVLENGKWSVPVNLGRPLNTSGDDQYFTIGGNGEKGYFSTQRNGVKALFQIDIPESMRPQPTMVVEGVVSDFRTKTPIGAVVIVEDLQTGEVMAVSKSNSSSGKYLVVLTAGKSYSVSANKEKYFFYSNRFDVPLEAKFTKLTKDISLQPIEKGVRVVLNNIFFETGKAALTRESRTELQKAADLMRINPGMVVEIGGHTDNVGEESSNMKLSHDRAKEVRSYLINAGIEPGRLQAKGYGETNPVADNGTEEGRKANRRTEFIIVDF